MHAKVPLTPSTRTCEVTVEMTLNESRKVATELKRLLALDPRGGADFQALHALLFELSFALPTQTPTT